MAEEKKELAELSGIDHGDIRGVCNAIHIQGRRLFHPFRDEPVAGIGSMGFLPGQVHQVLYVSNAERKFGTETVGSAQRCWQGNGKQLSGKDFRLQKEN